MENLITNNHKCDEDEANLVFHSCVTLYSLYIKDSDRKITEKFNKKNFNK